MNLSLGTRLLVAVMLISFMADCLVLPVLNSGMCAAYSRVNTLIKK